MEKVTFGAAPLPCSLTNITAFSNYTANDSPSDTSTTETSTVHPERLCDSSGLLARFDFETAPRRLSLTRWTLPIAGKTCVHSAGMFCVREETERKRLNQQVTSAAEYQGNKRLPSMEAPSMAPERRRSFHHPSPVPSWFSLEVDPHSGASVPTAPSQTRRASRNA